MKTEERSRLIELLRKLIYELTGNYYPDERMKILEYKLERLLKETGLESSSPEEIISFFMRTPERRKQLINLMTVPETRFFREREQLEVLFDVVLKGRSFLDMGSVGCSTGQEPYTLAMMMKRRNISGKVVGMDVNEEVLEKARRGVYKASEIKDIPEEYREFVAVENGLLEIRKDIKRMVEFRSVNLIEPESFASLKGRFDVVLCRNVLIYFDTKSKEIALSNLRSSLRKGGILVLSSTEILGKEFYHLFEPFKEDRFFFYRRT